MPAIAAAALPRTLREMRLIPDVHDRVHEGHVGSADIRRDVARRHRGDEQFGEPDGELANSAGRNGRTAAATKSEHPVESFCGEKLRGDRGSPLAHGRDGHTAVVAVGESVE